MQVKKKGLHAKYDIYYIVIVAYIATSQQNLLPVKHGHDTRGAAPTSDVAGHGDT